MNFLISDTFTDSLARLTADEQKAIKTTAFDLQVNPAHPSLQFHKLNRARDAGFSSVRVSSDIRLIVHRSSASLLLCYVDHHDAAYDWAERRKLETHPRTGAAQIVEIRETVREIVVPKYIEEIRKAPLKPPLFARYEPAQLLGYGVPEEWIDDVRAVVDEDAFLLLADHLPAEAAEALLAIATGSTPIPPATASPASDPFAHPDAQRRFRVIDSGAELERALAYPWERWTIFLHPAQRALVEKNRSGPARVSGSAGTGKTIVALHRAAFLAAENADARVLLTTFSAPLATALATKLRRLVGDRPQLRERIDVLSMEDVAARLIGAIFGKRDLATPAMLDEIFAAVVAHRPTTYPTSFLRAEFEQIVDAWQVRSWDAYRSVPRLGRKTRLSEKARLELWSIFAEVLTALDERAAKTVATTYAELAEHYATAKRMPYDFVVVDESQDISAMQLRFLAAIGANRPNALFFTGDIGQRIFTAPFSWKSLGVDVRGRSDTLRVNYRTSHQIRLLADRLLDPDLADADGNTESRKGTVSTFNGVIPRVAEFASSEEEETAVAAWLGERAAEGVVPSEIAVFVRSSAEIARAQAALVKARIPFETLDDRSEVVSTRATVAPMHLAKGHEFRTVAVMACDDRALPSAERLGAAGEDDIEEVHASERHLLYVACTRARDHLFLSGVTPISEFLGDLN